MTTVGLIQVDGKWPNLALMKLSAWHKYQGHDVVFPYNGQRCDHVYASAIFAKSVPHVRLLRETLGARVTLGGTGVDLSTNLPPEVEGAFPDYDLYGIDYGMGFTSRGCIRRCPWCVVPQKEGDIHSVASVLELMNPLSNNLILLDSNFLAQPEWEARAKELINLKVRVNFSQGLDIRLVDDHVASVLARIDALSHTFKKPRLHFAWDFPEMEPAVRAGIAALGRAGIKPWKLMFYVLVGYSTTFEEDMHRFRVLDGLGVDPFIMLYEGADKRLRHFARWVNKRIYRRCEWQDYLPRKAHDNADERQLKF